MKILCICFQSENVILKHFCFAFALLHNQTVLVQTSTQALSPSTAVLYQHSPVSEPSEYHTSQNESKAQVQQQTAQISSEPIQLQRFVHNFRAFKK